MIRELLYLTGAPGVGKSTLARELRTGWDTEVDRHHAVPHTRLNDPRTGRTAGLELGVPREEFPGTDALAMDIGPRALQFLSTAYTPFALGEGARLATRPFIGGLATAGVRVTLVRLTAGPALLEERWRARGARQNPSWRKGAATRADRLAGWFTGQLGQDGFHRYASIDATDRSPADVAAQVRDMFPHIALEVRQ